MTLAELQTRMTRQELGIWQVYVEQEGPLNMAQRIEAIVARAVTPFLKNVTPKQFLIWPKEPEKVATNDNIIDFFKSIGKRKK